MYRFGEKVVLAHLLFAVRGKKLNFYIISNFFKPRNPTEHFPLEVCIADF